MYLLCMIKARITWCTCRVENILTLGKLLSLWFCFLLHSILFLISQISYRTYKSSYELARPIMGTIFLVYGRFQSIFYSIIYGLTTKKKKTLSTRVFGPRNSAYFDIRDIPTTYVIGERAKQARHSQVCSIENSGYIYY